MAKTKRIEVGSVVKGRDGKPDYIKVNQDVMLKKGQFLNLESKKDRLASLNEAVTNGKLSAEIADKIIENVEKTPDFVRFTISYIEKL